jgi:hypothetical protein
MPRLDKQAAFNLSGAWAGLFNYPKLYGPVAFSADLVERGGWLTGATKETVTIGAASGAKITATLQGRRTGPFVTWLKLYDAISRGYDSVHYEGDVNEDATEIHGHWIVSGNWSGTFIMIRSAEADVALRRESREQTQVLIAGARPSGLTERQR